VESRENSPGNLRKVIGVETGESTSERESMSSTRSSAFLNSVRSHDRAKRLESGRRSVNVGEKGEITILHGSLIEGVKSEHVSSSCRKARNAYLVVDSTKH